MGPSKRQPSASVREDLFQSFFEFSFYKAVHLIESMNPDKKRLGEALTPDQEAVRFGVRPGFVFPPSDISALKPAIAGESKAMRPEGDSLTLPTETEPDLGEQDRQRQDSAQGTAASSSENAPEAHRTGHPFPARMEVAFLGLIGPSGMLPHWYNELAQDRLRKKDSTLVAFLDCFHHRLISLFYLAWKKHRFPETYLPGAKDRLSRHMLCLIGLGTPHLIDRIGLDPESLIFYSGLLSRSVPCASALEAAVAYFSGTAVKLHQFIDRIIPIEPDDQTQLGTANSLLGVDAACGSQAWESQTKFRVDLGPMGFKRFLRFLPPGDLFQPIFSLVRVMVGIEFEFDVGVVLKREEVPPCRLGQPGAESPRLGWTTWVKSPEFLHADHPRVIFQEPARN